MSDTEQLQDPVSDCPDVISAAGPQTPPSMTGVSGPRGGRRKSYKEPRGRPQDHWNELQELRGKLIEHEETIVKLRSAFGLIAVALDIQPGRPQADADGALFCHEMPANRPPRMSRRGGANSVNTSHYKKYNRGGGADHYTGGYMGYRGNPPGFSSRL